MIRFVQTTLSGKDMQSMKSLQKICLPYDRPYFEDKAWYWIGYYNQTPVAFCILVPSLQWRDAVYMARSGVLSEFRGKGLQKRMISIRESFARRRGYRWAVTDTTENPASSNSLISRGYRLYEPSMPWGFRHTLYWRKRLR